MARDRGEVLGVPNSHWDTKHLDDYLANHCEGCICKSCYHNCIHDAEIEFLSWFKRITNDIFEWSDISRTFIDLWEYGELDSFNMEDMDRFEIR